MECEQVESLLRVGEGGIGVGVATPVGSRGSGIGLFEWGSLVPAASEHILLAEAVVLNTLLFNRTTMPVEWSRPAASRPSRADVVRVAFRPPAHLFASTSRSFNCLHMLSEKTCVTSHCIIQQDDTNPHPSHAVHLLNASHRAAPQRFARS